jgi:hypothetical protein
MKILIFWYAACLRWAEKEIHSLQSKVMKLGGSALIIVHTSTMFFVLKRLKTSVLNISLLNNV